jgi:hypothetical protein
MSKGILIQNPDSLPKTTQWFLDHPDSTVPEINNFLEQGIYNICSVIATLNCLNHISPNLFSDNDIPNILDSLISSHNQPSPGGIYPEWYSFDTNGQIRYQFLASLTQKNGIDALVLENLPTTAVTDFIQNYPQSVLALSVNNSFSETYSNVNNLTPAGHVISIIGYDKTDNLIIIDPLNPEIIHISPTNLDHFSKHRGIVFGPNAGQLEPYRSTIAMVDPKFIL